MNATEVTAGLAESNGSLLLGLWRDSRIHVTCGLTACTPESAPGPTLGNEYGKTLPFIVHRYECVALAKDIGLQRGQFSDLCPISSLMYPTIQRRPVIMNVLHPGCARPPRWSPPVLWRRFEDGLASICVLIRSCKMLKESETAGLDDG